MKLDLKNSQLDRLRLASILDGISFVILMAVAMPLKYVGGNEIGVKITGPIHGALFLWLCWCLWSALDRKTLSFKWCVVVFVCALIPLAPFFLDGKLKRFRVKTAPPEQGRDPS